MVARDNSETCGVLGEKTSSDSNQFREELKQEILEELDQEQSEKGPFEKLEERLVKRFNTGY